MSAAKPIEAGDEVSVTDEFRAKAASIYGEAARRPFIVEGVNRDTYKRWVVTGAGMVLWRNHVKRTRTKLQIEREANGQAA